MVSPLPEPDEGEPMGFPEWGIADTLFFVGLFLAVVLVFGFLILKGAN